MDFYDKSGRTVAYINDSDHIYLYSGKPVAYVYNNSVYSFSGRHLGWFANGWVRDRSGACVMFTSEASGGPARPAKQAKPAKGARGALPAKGARQARPAMPAKQSTWSHIPARDFLT